MAKIAKPDNKGVPPKYDTKGAPPKNDTKGEPPKFMEQSHNLTKVESSKRCLSISMQRLNFGRRSKSMQQNWV
jgi:hypothetical protein